ncbi:unnamed protein product [Chondrus crispus]|uniref:Mini-chromosome maintenance complex-binding protein n=1 Tax=Chondrus crispus TaxID=2769 RepID=R7Q5W5_CHOCR|nr:unnamed protein product [Chondrus crispus]CDF33233.1 unnamed protein product [Chondrus crispus]|eukprot:XP_005713036.1 unnamed protein product [Chondrus crispus]
MVGLSFEATPDPVAASHHAIHQAGATVSSALSALQVPPLSAIPFIDSPTARPGRWAQCLAMVQDIWDAELFVASSPEGDSGLLVENAAATNDTRAKLSERLPVYLVSPPGEAAWIREARNPSCLYPTPNPSANSSRTKRTREDRDATEDQSMQEAPSATAPGTPAANGAASSSEATTDKRPRPSAQGDGKNGSVGLGLNHPVLGQAGAFAVVAKLYDATAGRELKVNTLVRVVGILQEAMPVASGNDAFAEEFAARNPEIVKRLHVVQMRGAEEWEINPATAALVANGGQQALAEARQELKAVLPGVRDMLIKYLSSALCDDTVAAEYLLMCLLSRPAQRTEGGDAIGKLSLNLVVPKEVSDSQPDFSSQLSKAIENVVNAVVPVELSIASLNARELYPKKDYTLNRLKAAPLQLAGGAVLLADETRLSNGHLAERGLRNVRALSSLAKQCTAPLDFQYYETEILVQCCPVFVSKGSKSIIPADVVVRIKPDTGLKLQKWDSYNEDLLRKMRLAMALLTEQGEFDISEGASKAVENEYVAARKSGQAKDGQATLQSWLALARCCSRSFGEAVLTPERWSHARQLEAKRAERDRR